MCRLPGPAKSSIRGSQQINPSYNHRWFVVGWACFLFLWCQCLHGQGVDVLVCVIIVCGVLFKNVSVWESGQILNVQTLGLILAMRCLYPRVGNRLTRSDWLSWRGRNRFVALSHAAVNMVQHALSSLILKAESVLRFRLNSLKISLRSSRGLQF